MRFLFWNTHNTKDINSILCGMIVEQKANIVILAEYEDIIEDLIYNLDLKGVRMNVYPSIGCDRLIILGNTKDIRQSRQSKYYSMQIIKNDMLLCGVHLPSQMWADERTQTLAFQSVFRDIELAEEDGGIDKTIVVGDFNQNPYDDGCLGACGFHGIPIADEAQKISRTIFGTKYKMFYNPMWNLLGDFSYPPGTYYYRGSKEKNEFWNIFDQVIVRPQLRSRFVDKELKIITKAQGVSLVTQNQQPNEKISDHLPIVFQLTED